MLINFVPFGISNLVINMSVKSEKKEKLKELLRIPCDSRTDTDLSDLSDLVSVIPN